MSPRRLIPFLLLVCLVCCPAARAQSTGPARPNVLFIVVDDLTATALHCYGNTVCQTPNIDRLAARGILFTNAFCQWPLCLPSRNSFLSGRRPDARFQAGDLLRNHVPDVTFLPEYFRKNGYFTARVGKIAHVRTIFTHDPVVDLEDPACWDVSDVGGIDHDPCGYAMYYTSAPRGLASHPELQSEVVEHVQLNKAGKPAYDYWIERIVLADGTDTTDAAISRRSSELLEQRSKSGKPFFLAAGFRRPHHNWAVPKSCYDLYPPGQIELTHQEPDDLKDIPPMALTLRTPKMSDDHKRMTIASYYAAVTHVDQQIGKLLDTMDRLKLWDNTIVLLTADHGWHLGEHDWLWGKVTLFNESARVPLIMVAPQLTKAGSTCPRTVEMIDFYPTLADLCSLPPPPKVDGQSITPLLKDPQSPHDHPAYSVLRRGKSWGRGVYTEQFRYAEYGDNASKGAELYDRKADPREYHNLANDPKYADTRAAMKKLLDAQTGNLHDGDTVQTGPTD